MIECYRSRASETRVGLRASVRGLALDESRSAWVEFAYEGKWHGHSAGAFEFDRAVFTRILENFARQDNPITLTYEHPSAYDLGQPVPAAGRIHQLELRDGDHGVELWGLVEFTARAAEMIRAGEYLYTSVVVDFAAIDRESGETIGPELQQVGLVNDPFLDGQTPIRLSRAATARVRRHMDKAQALSAVAKALGLGTDADLSKVSEALGLAPQDVVVEPKVALADDAPADAPAEDDAPKQDDGKLAELAALLEQVSGGMPLADIFDAISANPSAFADALGRKASDTGTADAQAATMSREMTVLRAEVARLSSIAATHAQEQAAQLAAQRTAEITHKVDGLVASGRLADASRDVMIALGVDDVARFEALVAALAPAVPTGTVYASRGPGATRVMSDLAPEHETQLRKQLESAGIRGAKQDQAVARHVERLAKRR